MSADCDHFMSQPAREQALDWDLGDLPVPEEPGWYAEAQGYPGAYADDPGAYADDPGAHLDAFAAYPRNPGAHARASGLDPDGLDAYADEIGADTSFPGARADDPLDDSSAQRAAFAEGGWADALAPDPLLATLVDLVQRDGLDKLDDDQLTGVLQAANRLAAWSASVRVAAVSGLAARREHSGRESGDWRPFDHVDDEVAVALTLTRRGAARLLDLALSLDRLPLTRAALAAGLIDERRAEVIAEEVAELDDAQAAAVEKLIIGRAPKLTSGQLRALVRRAVLSTDPKAARRRKEKALRDARVEMFPETSGTAALAGRDLPPAGVLAADKHLTALAQAMKAAGQPGTLDILRAWAYLHLLSGQPAATLIPATPPRATPHPATPHPANPPQALPHPINPPRAPGPTRQHRPRIAGRAGFPSIASRPRRRCSLPRGIWSPCSRRPRHGRAERHSQPDHAAVRVARLDRVPRRRTRLWAGGR